MSKKKVAEPIVNEEIMLRVNEEVMCHERTQAHELYMSYGRGWRDGAVNKAIDEKFSKHPTRLDLTKAYMAGYEDGEMDRQIATNRAARNYGYVPSILRTQDNSD